MGPVIEAMLEGICQQHSRMLQETTIGGRARLVRRFAEFTGQYPWQWPPSELRSGPKPVAFSTVRGSRTTLRLFVEFVTDLRYGWPALRNAALLKTVYAFGLRRREASMLDVAEWRRNPRAGNYGRFGAVQVRYGKSR
jgi:site-specific recombinase XerD